MREKLVEVLVAGFEIVGVHETKRVAAITAVGCPFLELLRIERGLRDFDCGAPEAGGFAGNGVFAFAIGHVVMKREPERGTCPG